MRDITALIAPLRAPVKGINSIGRGISDLVAGFTPAVDERIPDACFLLPDEIKETLSAPLEKVGFPIDSKIGKIRDPSFQHHLHYRSYVKEGYLAYLYFGNRQLEQELQATYWHWVGYEFADNGAKGIFIFSDTNRITDTYEVMGLRWIKRNSNLAKVKFFKEEFTRRLINVDAEFRVQLVKEYFELDMFEAKPRAQLTWKDLRVENAEVKEEKNKIILIISIQAANAAHPLTARDYLSILIDKTIWPPVWKRTQKGALTGVPDPDAEKLLQYALDKGSLPDVTPLLTALGNLLEKIIPDLGAEHRTVIKDFITKYNLAPVEN